MPHNRHFVSKWGTSMLQWLRARIGLYQQRYIEQLVKENRALKKRLLELNNGQPIRLFPQEKKRLDEKRKGIDPDLLKSIGDIDDD